MKSFLTKVVVTGSVLMGLLGAANAFAGEKKGTDLEIKKVDVTLSKGQVLSVIAPIIDPKGKPALDEYLQKVFPIAQGLGLKQEAGIKVTASPVGDFSPEGILLFSWPTQDAADQLVAHPNWPKLKALRPVAWKELNIYTSELDKDLSLSFRSDKHYTLAVAWLNPAHPKDYDAYLDGIKHIVKKAGGRFMYKMRQPVFESNQPLADAPNQLTFVEWDSPDGLEKLQAMPEYKEYYPLLINGVVGFEFHLLKV